jgi:predicted DNA-binding transcriptional regulator AlpA
MTDYVLIPVPGLGVLKLTEEAFKEALSAGAELLPAEPSSPPEPADFIPLKELSKLTGLSVSSLYNAHVRGSKRPLAGVITKLGGRTGVWRVDYEAWLAKQRQR